MRGVVITEDEIRRFPNDFALGDYVRKKFYTNISVDMEYEELFDITDNPIKEWVSDTTNEKS